MADFNRTDAYDLDLHVAEVYDQTETYTDDIDQIRWLLGESGPLRILEPCCGTGRILIPLAEDGHTLVGFDKAAGMVNRARTKVAQLPDVVQQRITLFEGDVLTTDWSGDFDLVILGGNCFYALPSTADQATCIRSAYASLRDGGFLCIDNNCRRGRVSEQDLRWRGTWPTGLCEDGTRLTAENSIVDIDVWQNFWHEHRKLRISAPDGREQVMEWQNTVHPVSMEEVCSWLADTGFTVLGLFGNRQDAPFTADDRTIFWAQKFR